MLLIAAKRGESCHHATERCTALALDANDHVWLGGSFGGLFNFGGGDSAAYGLDAYVAELDGSGAYVSAVAWPGPDDQQVTALALDSLGNVVVTGSLAGSADFGNGELTSANATDVFLLERDAQGTLWSKVYGGIDVQLPVWLAMLADDDMLLAVRLDDVIDFGGGELASAGATDVAVARLGP